jgi:hypothetical protein
LFSEKIVEEYGYTLLQHGYDAAELGNSVSEREEGGVDEDGGANQDEGFPGALDLLEVTAPLQWWEEDFGSPSMAF